ncbi:MAG: FHA domain-containing protein [Cyanobacteria bacterium J06641_5]
MTTVTVDLVHPIRQDAVQSWTFDATKTSIRIGRSRHNDITLFSGVVSREHAMLEFDGRVWMLRSLGTNGCFLNDRLVRNPVISDGDIFRVARTGPRLRVRIHTPSPAATNRRDPWRALRSATTARTAPRSRLSQEEIVTARETWMAPADMSRALNQRPHPVVRRSAKA